MLAKTTAVLATLLLLPTTTASAYVLGAADGNVDAAPIARQLGARTYRLIMDSTIPLEAYAPRVEAFRAQGMVPQIVVDGTGTTVRGKTGRNWQTINYAIRAYQRWPDAYSVSVLNEPDLAGLSACQYARTFRRAYKMLKAAGVRRVLFGEWSPHTPREWTLAAMRCLPQDTVADGWAWHGYDVGADWYGIQHAADIRRFLRSARHDLHTRMGEPLPVYCTEYGMMTRGPGGYGETDAAARWSRALSLASRYGFRQIVAWQILELPAWSRWDSSLVDSTGRPRAAFATIVNR